MFFRKKKALKEFPGAAVIPAHVGIIMDGNGRWAKQRRLPRSAGHKAGAENFRTITRYAKKVGIKYLTLYAFSTENWSRPAEEVNALMGLFTTIWRKPCGISWKKISGCALSVIFPLFLRSFRP